MTPATAHRLDARWLLPGLLLLLLALAVMASGLGFIAVSPGQVLRVVASRLPRILRPPPWEPAWQCRGRSSRVSC